MIFLSSRLLKKSLKLIKSMQVFTWLSNRAFHLLLIWLQILLVINSESCQRLFPSFMYLNLKSCAVWFVSEQVAVLFNSSLNLHRLPFLSQIAMVNLVLLLCTGIDWKQQICSYVLFLFRDLWIMNDQKIEQSYECCFIW